MTASKRDGTILEADIVIVGAGVVGLAIARAIASTRRTDRGVILLDRNGRCGEETSSRNSEVVHAGLYYPPDSLKARHCLRGRRLLYEYCDRHGIACRRLGKLVVGRADEQPRLEALFDNALAAGVEEKDLLRLDASAIHRLEPALSVDHALLSRQSGIVDSHALMQTLLDEAVSLGVTWAPLTRVERVDTASGQPFILHLRSGSGNEPVTMTCHHVINAAGLGAAGLAQRITGEVHAPPPPIRLVKGQYFSWRGRPPFQRLVYPLPPSHGNGLGVHATLDLAGQVRFGPDTEVVDGVDYRVDEGRRQTFVEAIQRYFPGVDARRLEPDYAGIRARVPGPGESFSDFVIRDESDRGLPGLIQLFGIESPGLTAALSIAESVSDRIADLPRRYAYRPR